MNELAAGRTAAVAGSAGQNALRAGSKGEGGGKKCGNERGQQAKRAFFFLFFSFLWGDGGGLWVEA